MLRVRLGELIMASLRVFVSSTCYDLSIVRSQLRMFIQSLGHEPVMSDYSDVLYDPRVHTHTSCIDEVSTCDIVVLIVGSRFGGKGVPEALSLLDFDKLITESKSIKSIENKENLSITQLEILKAVEEGIPVFTFIEERVWHDHALYERNKHDKELIEKIDFPSIERKETAQFIFEFINYLRHRAKGNSVFQFSKIQDIEEILRKQWSALFQRLLQEQRHRNIESKRLDMLTEQFEDLKTAILTSIGTSNEREVARGVVRFRRLIDFLRGLGVQDSPFVIKEKHSWDELLKYVGIEKIISDTELPTIVIRNRHVGHRGRTYLIKEDGTYYEMRYPLEFLSEMSLEWEAFCELSPDSRAVIIDALADMRFGPPFIRYYRRPFNEYIERLLLEQRHREILEESDLDEDE